MRFANAAPRVQNDGTMPVTRYSTKEVADILKVSLGRVLDLIEEGRFPNAVKINNKWEIPVEDIENFSYKPTGRPKKRPGRPRKTRT